MRRWRLQRREQRKDKRETTSGSRMKEEKLANNNYDNLGWYIGTSSTSNINTHAGTQEQNSHSLSLSLSHTHTHTHTCAHSIWLPNTHNFEEVILGNMFRTYLQRVLWKSWRNFQILPRLFFKQLGDINPRRIVGSFGTWFQQRNRSFCSWFCFVGTYLEWVFGSKKRRGGCGGFRGGGAVYLQQLNLGVGTGLGKS
jgi:hypothetical protein